MARSLTVVRDLAGATALEEVIAIVRGAVRDLTGADGGTVVLREDDRVRYVDEDAIAPLWKGHSFPIAQCISGWVVERREAVVIADVSSDPRIPHALYAPTFVRSLAMVPIGSREAVGAIGAYWSRPHHATAKELGALRLLGDAAAIAIERAALLRAEREARSAADTLREAQTDLVRVVAHDIRNPLNAVMMSATLLQHVADESPLGERVRRQAAAIQRAGGRIGRLVADLSDHGALQAGAFRVERAPHPVGPILEAVHELDVLAEHSGHTLTIVPPSSETTVACEPDRVTQAISNLVRNALEHTPPGTRIVVSARDESDAVVFEVQDDGPGIPEEVLATIYQRYAHRSRSVRGTGLGLFIVKGIVEAHGGQVLHATGPAGTTFRLRFPRS